MNERADLDVEIGRRGIVRAAPDRKASQSAYSASFSPFPSAIYSPDSFSPSVSSSPRKGCALFPSRLAVQAYRKKALRADATSESREIKFPFWKILTFPLLDVVARCQTLITRINSLISSARCAQMLGFEGEITRFARAIDRALLRKTAKNGEKRPAELYTSIG